MRQMRQMIVHRSVDEVLVMDYILGMLCGFDECTILEPEDSGFYPPHDKPVLRGLVLFIKCKTDDIH